MKISKVRRNQKKALSTVIGGLIIFGMILSVGYGYFYSITQSQQAYQKIVKLQDQASISQGEEDLTVVAGVPEYNLGMTITNIGISANITGYFVTDNSTGVTTYTSIPGGQYVDVAQTVNLLTSTTYVTGDNYILKVLTERGNTYSAQYPPASNSLARLAGVTNGIGSFGMVFDSFRFFSVDSYNLGSGYRVGGYFGSEIPNGKDSLFQLQVTNYDPNLRAITLTERSALLLGGGANNFFYINGDIVDYSSNQVGAESFYNYTIPYGATATLNFSTPQPGQCVNPTGPGCGPNPQNSISGDAEVVILLFGFYSDNTVFAQAIPFASTYGTTAQITTNGPLSGTPGSQITLALKNFVGGPGGDTWAYWGTTSGSLDEIATGSINSITFTIPSGTPAGYYAVYISDGVNIAYATVQVT